MDGQVGNAQIFLFLQWCDWGCCSSRV